MIEATYRIFIVVLCHDPLTVLTLGQLESGILAVWAFVGSDHEPRTH